MSMRLEHWQEVLGVLKRIEIHGGKAFLTIGDIEVAIPDVGFVERLEGRIGQRVGILRTDLEGREYLFRELRSGGGR